MASGEIDETASGVHPEQCREQLQRILSIRCFAKSPRRCSMLEFICTRTLDGPPDDLTEQRIGICIFGRKPAAGARHCTSAAVEALIPRVQRGIGDRALKTIFANCFPNTLDTTVYPGSYEGKPETRVVTGEIDAMWLRNSSAQMWPHLPLANERPGLLGAAIGPVS